MGSRVHLGDTASGREPADDGSVEVERPDERVEVGGSHGRVDDEAFGVYGLGGPAAPDGPVDDVVDARSAAPTITALLGITDEVATSSDYPSLLK